VECCLAQPCRAAHLKINDVRKEKNKKEIKNIKMKSKTAKKGRKKRKIPGKV